MGTPLTGHQVGDPTGDGFICDDSADPVGCIFSTNMLVADATEAEIASHLAGAQVSTNVVAAQADQADLAQLAAQKAIAAALSANATVAAAAADGVTAKCTTAVRQTVQQSDNSGGTAALAESDGIATCVGAQQAA